MAEKKKDRAPKRNIAVDGLDVPAEQDALNKLASHFGVASLATPAYTEIAKLVGEAARKLKAMAK